MYKKFPVVSIIIVNWNVIDLVENCINTIFHQKIKIPFEIIVVDNNSSDNTIQVMNRIVNKYKNNSIKLVQNKVNLGFGAANNIGFKYAKGKFILLLNPDTEFMEDCITQNYYYLLKNEEYGAVGSKIIYPDGSIYQPAARGLPKNLRIFYHMFLFPKIFPKIKQFNAINLLNIDKNRSTDVECLVGAYMMIPAKVYQKIGGFNEKYFMYGEDIDLCFKILKKGYKIRYNAETSIIHYTEKSSKKTKINNFKTVMRIQSRWIFQNENYGIPSGKVFKLIMLLGSAFRLYILTGILFIRKLQNKKDSNLKINIYENKKNISWILGFENWVNKDEFNVKKLKYKG